MDVTSARLPSFLGSLALDRAVVFDDRWVTAYVADRFSNVSSRPWFVVCDTQGRIHWTQPFLRRLVGNVKVVGPTISCEGSPINGDMQGKWRRNPHVQSYVVATDRVRVAG